MGRLVVVFAFLVWTAPAAAQDLERYHQLHLCNGMTIGKHLPNGTVADCVSDTHAIEVDFDAKWAEAIGQSLQYASALELLPGIILVCRKRDDGDALCLNHALLIEQTLAYWRIEMSLWLCPSEASELASCRFEEINGP